MHPLDFDLFDFGPGRGGGAFGIVGGILGMLFWLALIALVVVAIVYLVRRVRTTEGAVAVGPTASTAQAGVSTSAARSVLDERFARGEINAEEYTQRRTLLDGGA